MIQQSKSYVTKLIDFLRVGVWRIRADKLSKTKSFWIRQLRIILLAIRGFDEDKCTLRASALTFFSLLSVVPIVAMAFGIAKGFGFEKKLETELLEKMPGQEEVAAQIIDFAQSFLQNTQGGVIAGIGVAVLFWTVIKVLGQIESAFNDVWGIRKSRSFGRKFSDYLSIMLICPILLIMSSSLTVMVTSQVTLIMEKITILGPVAPFILKLLKLLPYAVLWIVFTFVYIFMPNTEVKFRSGILAGIIAGTIYQLVQWVYITFQIGASKYGAIYGSFAALPLFLIWLQVSWLVVLFGAEISFAEQNVETYEFEPDCLKVSRYFKNLMSLRIVHLCVQNFVNEQKPWRASEISHALEMPIRLTRELLFELVEAKILSEVKLDDTKPITAYQPARDVERLSIRNVLDALDNYGSDDLPVADSDELAQLKRSFKEFQELVHRSPSNLVLKNI